ncbi:hypothetical protein SDRG_09401 [Saprolegnia diclina VS20]|uniref:Uncharacterized protein n=1 Tax=Saprolegnia diclina (strain VS20) TaxID=1156394 RepID=T0Q4W4_SAPDV|nr:hypothetical protein SDRG_09401 [Saprolegnia diclina VS20]EQC32869.1 hypothetical protein SDRG_09401 [Saprolegnia diclina VS20]|eukprot:XP_008613555.1 hypothetical protein SDRG_09401 [Saprolegnia diclina VS20]
MLRQRWVIQVACGAAAFSASVAMFNLVMETQDEDDERSADDASRPLLPASPARPSLRLSSQSTIAVDAVEEALETLAHGDEPCILSPIERARINLFWDDLATTLGGDAYALQDLTQHAQGYAQRFPVEFPLATMLKAISIAASHSHNASRTNVLPPMRRRSTLSLMGNKLFEMAVDTKGGMQNAMHRAVRRYLERALDLFAERLKDSIKDKDMPLYLQSNIDVAVDQFLPDVKLELFRKTKDLFVATTTTPPLQRLPSESGDATSASLPQRAASSWANARACILYNLFPYDQSIWRCLKNPYWWSFTILGMLPYIGQAWWCLLFVLKDKRDEHQLCQFIIGFKTSQFLTLGLGSTILGVAKYIACALYGTMGVCDLYGPMLSPWNTLFFLWQTALVWVAFFYLPYTERPSTATVLSPKHATAPKTTYQDMFGNVLHMDRGGYLMKLCGYETIAFCFTMGLALAAQSLLDMTWQRQNIMFWIRTLYGLLSLPYLPFKIPLVENVLLHTCRMGYDARGRTVRMVKGAPSSSAT